MEKNWSCGWSWVVSWLCGLSVCSFCIFVGRRGKNDHERANVGRVVRSKIETSEDEIDKIRSVKLVV